MLEFVPLIPLLAIVAVSWQLIVADFSEHRLPNKYTGTLIVVSVASLSGYAIATNEYSRLSQTLIAMALSFGSGWLLAKYADLGMGDVKLLVSLNGWLAWNDPWLVALSLVVGLVAANIFAVAVWIKRKDPKEHIALGPFLLLGFYVIAITPGWQIFTAAVSSLA